MRRAPDTYVLFETEAIMDKVYDLSPWEMPLVRRKACRAVASLCWRPESTFQVLLEIAERGRVVGIVATEKLQLIEAVASARLEVESKLMLEPIQRTARDGEITVRDLSEPMLEEQGSKAGLAHRPGYEHIGMLELKTCSQVHIG